MPIIEGNNVLDNAEVPETGRYLTVTPDIYVLMKRCRNIVMETDIGSELRVNHALQLHRRSWKIIKYMQTHRGLAALW